MKYLIEMDKNASKPETLTFANMDAAGAAREVFAACRDNPFIFAARLVAVSETGQRMTLDRITH